MGNIRIGFYCYLNLESTKTYETQEMLVARVLLLLKSWEYKNLVTGMKYLIIVLLLLKSWEYKNSAYFSRSRDNVLLLLKSWEYKNLQIN